MRQSWLLGSLLVLTVGFVGVSFADDVTGRWGVGAFMDYNMPTMKFADWYSGANKFGMDFIYVPAQKISVEVEYHRSHFDHGSPETRTFTWSVDKKPHSSPNAKADMKFNSLLVNGLIHMGKTGPQYRASTFSPYIAVGGGFYRFQHNVSGLLWPGQANALVLTLPAYTDQQFALGMNVGFGVEAFIVDNVAVDIRARYNFVIGQLRSLEDWGLKETFPLQMLDLGGGLRFYFGKK